MDIHETNKYSVYCLSQMNSFLFLPTPFTCDLSKQFLVFASKYIYPMDFKVGWWEINGSLEYNALTKITVGYKCLYTVQRGTDIVLRSNRVGCACALYDKRIKNLSIAVKLNCHQGRVNFQAEIEHVLNMIYSPLIVQNSSWLSFRKSF